MAVVWYNFVECKFDHKCYASFALYPLMLLGLDFVYMLFGLIFLLFCILELFYDYDLLL